MIYLERVTKDYISGRDYFRGINDVTFAIEKGEIVSILGPSGSGKSTLLKVIGGLLDPSDGSVLVEEDRLQELNKSKRAAFHRRKIGYIPQVLNFPNKTALKIILEPLSKFKVIGDKIEYGKSMLKKVGLSGAEDKTTAQLSGGELQKLAIARALITQPKIILADEPVSNLDWENRNKILEILRGLAKEGKTVVIATQDPILAAETRRVIHLENGKVKDFGLPEKTEVKAEKKGERIITEIN